jgi:alpha-tubulin suppressor-like RCC1 family protein
VTMIYHRQTARSVAAALGTLALLVSCVAEDVESPESTELPLKSGDHVDGSILTAFLSCVEPAEAGHVRAHFGYENDTGRPLFVPVGWLNAFSRWPLYRSQPTLFKPGRHERAFSIAVASLERPLTWRLGASRAILSKTSPLCRAPFAGITSAVAGSDRRIALAWTPVTDSSGEVFYDICISTRSGRCIDDFSVSQSTSSGASMWNVAGLEPDTQYYFVVRSRVNGTPDTNTIEVGARTGRRNPLTAGYNHTCVSLSDGSTECWGDSSAGQLGNGNVAHMTGEHVEVSGLLQPVALTAGAAHTCALLLDATVTCWGSNSYGQLGNGTLENRYAPSAVPGLNNVIELAAGRFHTCAVRTDGTVWCWGVNFDGQLGDGSTARRSTPTLVPNLEHAVAIAAAPRHTCALLADGSARCWGDNSAGQIGDGTQDTALLPRPVVGLERAVVLSAGGSATCSLAGDGTVSCWGDSYGEQALVTSPSIVPDLSGVVGLALSDQQALALKADGSVVWWGATQVGRLDDSPTFVRSATPVLVTGIENATALIAGYLHACAASSEGSIQCWGNNDYGQIGDGTYWYVRPDPTTVACLFDQTVCANECVMLSNDASNCGNCGVACPGGIECSDGRCCPIGTELCGGTCLSVHNDPNNCGSCGYRCPPDATCSNGYCQCPQGTLVCGLTCIDVSSDAQNCGTCGHACPSGIMCAGGRCACPDGTQECGAACLDLHNDPQHCGACDSACPVGVSCSGGQCQCPQGTTQCGSVACADLSSDPMNCGSCGRGCPTGIACVGGQCACPLGKTACGSVCLDLSNDIHHCGGCDFDCAKTPEFGYGTFTPPDDYCQAGRCACPPGTSLGKRPGGTRYYCLDFKNDPYNCGTVGNVCPLGACANGACVCPSCPPGAFCGAVSGNCECSYYPYRADPVTGCCGQGCPSGSKCGFGGCICENSGQVIPPDGRCSQ